MEARVAGVTLASVGLGKGMASSIPWRGVGRCRHQWPVCPPSTPCCVSCAIELHDLGTARWALPAHRARFRAWCTPHEGML